MLLNIAVRRFYFGYERYFREVKITVKVHRDEFLEKQYLPVFRLIKNNKWRWQAVGAVLASAAGLLSPLIALVLNLLASYTRLIYEKPFLSKLSTVLYVIAVPLLLLGAHFLDLLDKTQCSLPEENPIGQTLGQLGLPAKAEDF